MYGSTVQIVNGAPRKVYGHFRKCDLISSHVCRRSFATNLYGQVPNSVIKEAGGWSSETMMLKYIKKSNREHAEVLKEHWELLDEAERCLC